MLPLLGSFFCHVWALALCGFLFTAVHSKGVACTMNEMYLEVVQDSWLPYFRSWSRMCIPSFDLRSGGIL